MKVRAGPAKGAVLVLDLRQNGSYWLGTYDQWILSHIRIQDWLPRGGVAWDCGAYTGYYAAIFRHAVGERGQVIAFEASTQNYERLRQMPALNGWPNVQITHCAVGPDHTKLDFAGELGGASGPAGIKPLDHPMRSERVDCAGIDELCIERGVPVPDFIKLDLEGAEIFALHNGNCVFTEKRPVVLLEMHAVRGGSCFPAVGSFLSKYDYLAWDVRRFDQRLSEPFADAQSLENAWSCNTLCNTLVCIPRQFSAKRRHKATRSEVVTERVCSVHRIAPPPRA